MVFTPDGRVELVPMKAVPSVQTELSTGTPDARRVQKEMATYRVGDGWLTRGQRAKVMVQQHSESIEQWAERHAVEIDQYNAWASQREPYSQRVSRWRESVASQSEAGKR